MAKLALQLLLIVEVDVLELPSFYRQDVADELQKLAGHGGCPGANLTLIDEGPASSTHQGCKHLFRVQVHGRGAVPKRRAVFIFGEHARELISTESALHFLETLCAGGDQVDAVLHGKHAVLFDILPDLNPEMRAKAVIGEGQWCQREDSDGVDLNRNYGGGAHWSKSEVSGFHPGETNPGPSAFSEVGSKLVEKLLAGSPSLSAPSLFAAVHSGEFAMFWAPAWTAAQIDVKSRNASAVDLNMTSSAQAVSPTLIAVQHGDCSECVVGPLGQYEGFELQGTSLDFAAGLSIPSTLLEIYTGSDEMKAIEDMEKGFRSASDAFRSKKAPSFLQQGLVHRHSHAQNEYSHDDEEACMRQFNPLERGDYDKTLQRWSKIYLQLAMNVVARAK